MPDKFPLKHQIIALTGKAHAGKSTVIEAMIDLMSGSRYYPTLVKFAAPLYRMHDYCYEQAGLEKPKSKDRQLLQYLGTEWGRAKSETIWTDLWRKEVRSYLFKYTESKRGIVLNDDCRFTNEAELIKEMGGIVLRIEAPEALRKERCVASGCNCMNNTSTQTHVSENGIPDDMIYGTIYNQETPADLRRQVRYMLVDGLL